MPGSIRNPRTLQPPPGYSHVAIATGSTLAFVAGQSLALPALLIEIEPVVSLA